MIIAESPPLPGALCRGRDPFWDLDVDGETKQERDERHAAALYVCSRCPEIQPCRAWGEQAPRARYGVWGGRLHIERLRRNSGTGLERSATDRTRPPTGERIPDAATAA